MWKKLTFVCAFHVIYVVYRMPCRERLYACAHDSESLIEYVNNIIYYLIRIVTKFIFSTENDLPPKRDGQCLGSTR